MMTARPTPSPTEFLPLAGVRVLSLALNLPGPAALMRCRDMGARCIKLEPPAPGGAAGPGDAMSFYAPGFYAALHDGMETVQADLKTDDGQRALHAQLARADVLITSFRPSALVKLGLAWDALHAAYPRLCQVAIVGAAGARAEEPGHDLTYLAESGLVTGVALPATLHADMAGSLMASEAVLQALLWRASHGTGTRIEVALASAAEYIALPRQWGMTLASGVVGGAHAGYRVYACADGRVAVAALEPHFARRLCEAAGIDAGSDMLAAATRDAITAWLATRTRAQLDRCATEKDIPMHALEA